MKKNIVVVFFLFLSLFCYSADFKIIKDTKIYDGDYNFERIIKKDTIVKLWDTSIRDQRKNSKLDFDYSVCLNIDEEKYLMDAASLIPAETQDLFDNEILTHKLKENGRYWASNTVCEILKSNTRDSYYKIHKKKIDNYNSKIGNIGNSSGPHLHLTVIDCSWKDLCVPGKNTFNYSNFQKLNYKRIDPFNNGIYWKLPK